MNPFTLRTLRQLAIAGATACAVAAVGLVSSAAAEPSAPMAAHMDENGHHDAMAKQWAEHLQARLDRLAERLEIKASQQAAWQKFTATFKDTMGAHAMMGHPDMEAGSQDKLDAATLARRHADRAEQHAQKLAQLADATATLQQSLSPDQRLVFDEVARHFARTGGPMGHPGHMNPMGHDGDNDHCAHRDHEHGYGHPGHASNDEEEDAHAQLHDEAPMAGGAGH